MSAYVNPLKEDALTMSTVRWGDRIICWKPGEPSSRRNWTIRSEVYPQENDGGTLVVTVENNDGYSITLPADQIGLCGNRFTGEWSVIAILNEEAD